jgi:hypothetical protein
VTGYELDDRVSIPGGSRDASLRQRFKTGPGVHTASYPIGKRSLRRVGPEASTGVKEIL